jgi:hypothetical protein
MTIYPARRRQISGALFAAEVRLLGACTLEIRRAASLDFQG